MTDKRKAFEAEFPIPNSVEWCDGDYKFKQYPTPDNMAEVMEFSRIIGAWQGWQARGAQQEHVTEDMIEAGINNAGGGGSMRDWCINVYKAMIAAQEKP
jgi:hypothetical protein